MERVSSTAPEYVRELLQSYIIFTNAYIALAMEPTKSLTDKRMTKNILYSNTKIDPKHRLPTCLGPESLHMPCVFTAPPQIRPGRDYGEGVNDPIGSERIESFERTFDLTETGLHRPKIVVCNGTGGGKYKQLVKGDGTYGNGRN